MADTCPATTTLKTAPFRGRTLFFQCDRERDHEGPHHGTQPDGSESFWLAVMAPGDYDMDAVPDEPRTPIEAALYWKCPRHGDDLEGSCDICQRVAFRIARAALAATPALDVEQWHPLTGCNCGCWDTWLAATPDPTPTDYGVLLTEEEQTILDQRLRAIEQARRRGNAAARTIPLGGSRDATPTTEPTDG